MQRRPREHKPNNQYRPDRVTHPQAKRLAKTDYQIGLLMCDWMLVSSMMDRHKKMVPVSIRRQINHAIDTEWDDYRFKVLTVNNKDAMKIAAFLRDMRSPICQDILEQIAANASGKRLWWNLRTITERTLESPASIMKWYLEQPDAVCSGVQKTEYTMLCVLALGMQCKTEGEKPVALFVSHLKDAMRYGDWDIKDEYLWEAERIIERAEHRARKRSEGSNAERGDQG